MSTQLVIRSTELVIVAIVGGLGLFSPCARAEEAPPATDTAEMTVAPEETPKATPTASVTPTPSPVATWVPVATPITLAPETATPVYTVSVPGTGIQVGVGTPVVSGTNQCVDEVRVLTGSVGVDVSVRGTFGPRQVAFVDGIGRRAHTIFMQMDFNGSPRLEADSTLAGNLTTWSVRQEGRSSGTITANILVWQQLRKRRSVSNHTVATATVVAQFSLRDSVTFGQTCAGVSSDNSEPALELSATIVGLRFYGLFFPNLQGPIISGIRHRIEARIYEEANARLQQELATRRTELLQRYQQAKSNLLNSQMAQLPQGCSCPS